MSHDVGLALEEYESINKDLTASNKIFEYLRAGLAVIATETRGQREVMAECTEAGLLIPPGDPELLTNAMQRMINEPELLLNARNRAAEAAQGTWAWETHSRDLAFSISAALKEASTRNGFNPSPGQVEVQENP
jgi:glycosyltransferase involved in cell wall biosynthesis